MAKLIQAALLILTGLVFSAGTGLAEPKDQVPKQGPPPRHLKQLPDGHWTANKPLAATEGYEVHTVKNGETLWEITRQYLKDPLLWPQVWELNLSIVNPHWIYPGDQILLKKMVVVAPTPETSVPEAASSESNPPSAAPPSGQTVWAPVQEAPATPPAPVAVASFSQIYCAGFFTADEIRPGMVIAGGEEAENKTLFYDHDVVYINKGALVGVKPGDEYLVIRKYTHYSRYGPDVAKASSQSRYGFGYQDLGRVRILLAHENSATAEIIFACETLQVGDILIPNESRVAPVDRPQAPFDKFAPPSDKTRGKIFFAREYKTVIGKGDIIYADVGQQQSVQTGDYFRVIRYFNSSNISAFNRDDYRKYRQTYDAVRKVIGEAVVLRVEAKTITALVTYSTTEISLGDGVELE